MSPGDTILDLRQFLSEAPETCFYTSYDLIMTTKDGIKYHLIDYIEVGEVTDVTGGGCLLEMYPALYDERSVRFHLRKFRELVSTAYSYSSLSTTLAAEHEEAHNLIHDKENTETQGKEKEKNGSGEDLIIPPELESLGFEENSPGLLKSLLLNVGTEESDCIQSLFYSSFNPVPGYRRLENTPHFALSIPPKIPFYFPLIPPPILALSPIVSSISQHQTFFIPLVFLIFSLILLLILWVIGRAPKFS